MQTIKKFRKFMKDEQRFALKREQEAHDKKINAKTIQTKAYWVGRHDGLAHIFCESLSYQDAQYLHDFCSVCLEEFEDLGADSTEDKGFCDGIRIASGYLAGVLQDMEEVREAYKASREGILERVCQENPVGNKETEIAFFGNGKVTMRNHVGPAGTVWRTEPVVVFSVKHDPNFSHDKLDYIFNSHLT